MEGVLFESAGAIFESGGTLFITAEEIGYFV
jgi:hypothetical protein